MILQASLSRKGTHRTENRDASGSTQNSGASLYVIADGTSKPGSGQLARALSNHLLEGFGGAQPSVVSCPDQALKRVLTSLDEVHSNVCPDFPFASTSCLVLLVVGQTAISIHAGDCCLGYRETDQRMNWLSPPHCGPNWKGDLSHSFIANSPARKTLLNCMSHRRAHEPHIQSLRIAPDTTWILATDGFWAELSVQNQLKAIAKQTLGGVATEDDVTFMLLRT
ncbi:PP2C family serine/threonine-protein phosphatase [Pseudomonas sp. S5D5]|uniref:PP2C family protein-serine/threonine phosphatase n=1 Tax=Pseudomonas sp. S5D5 TaxID=2083056 RepID=UPI000D0F4BDF|nr:protein phosphatase 2C domain-containing protein [Pseudomonas sp. S5D5]